MKKLFALLAVASFALACTDSQVETLDTTSDGEKRVILTVKQAPSTRGVSENVAENQYAVIGSGLIFFIDDNDNNLYKRELTNAEITTIQNTSSTAQGSGSIQIEGVPNSATKLLFIANVSTAQAPSYPQIVGATGTTSQLRVDLLQGDINYTPMSGLSGEFTGTDPITAEVEICPLLSRIEIGQVEYMPSNPEQNVDIEEFELGGIYINNIHESVTMSGLPQSQTLININQVDTWDGDQWQTLFTNNANFPYYTASSVSPPSGWIANSFVDYGDLDQITPARTFYPNSTSGAGNAVEDEDFVWSYQVVPSGTTGNAEAPDVPHIILRLLNTTYVNDTNQQSEQYVTVTKYQTTDGTPVESFERGNIYRISNLTFSNKQATDKPYEDNISVVATVSVKPWVVNEIEPDWSEVGN